MAAIDIFDVLLMAYIALNVYLIPHTKIEEIFQVNNIYDHLYLGSNIPDYDFIIFDGVVYRTFLSSLMIAIIDYPFKYLVKALGLTTFSMLIISRVTLGFLNVYALRQVRNSIESKFKGDKYISKAFAIVRLSHNTPSIALPCSIPLTFLFFASPPKQLRVDLCEPGPQPLPAQQLGQDFRILSIQHYSF